MSAEGVRMRFIGDRRRLDAKLQKMMAGIEDRTAPNSRVNLTVAINYGGRDELVRAARAMCVSVASGNLNPDDVTEDQMMRHLDTEFLPDPDLVIRTSGETRVSNFLLWQAAYAEYVFTQTLWPDFTVAHLAEILGSYAGRERRFGAANPA